MASWTGFSKFTPLALAITGALTALALSSCGVGRKEVHGGEEQVARGKVRADAYLFDTKIRRNGKPTSIRLEMYRTDSVVALAGRAYLGKGALRGRMTADSLEIYFPTANEYLYSSIADAVNNLKCNIKLGHIDLLHILTTPPDTVSFAKPLQLRSDTTDQNRRSYALWVNDCPWQMTLLYDWVNSRWELREFKFDSGTGTELRAERREFDRNVSLDADRFAVHYPGDAVRLEP
jgi:hypothetical protein